jgi:hypothetical protein
MRTADAIVRSRLTVRMPTKRTKKNLSARPRRMSVFVASPGDVADERNVVSLVVAEINRVLGEHLGFSIETVRWETDAHPGVGDDPQDVINRQIGVYDVFVGIMWRRFGTPTKRAGSGTGEEFQRALAAFKKNGRPTIMFYFRNEPFYSTDQGDLKQFARVAKFQKDLRSLGVLYWSYRSPLEFERNVREHLMRHLLTASPNPATTTAGAGRRDPKATQSEKLFPTTSVGTVVQSIFLAYSHADGAHARAIFRELSAAGHRVWMDTEALLPGQMWWREVEKAVAASGVFMPLISERTPRTHSGALKEFEVVQHQGPRAPTVIPVRLDPTPLPEALAAFQAVDFFLPDGPQRLLEALQRRPHSAGLQQTPPSRSLGRRS